MRHSHDFEKIVHGLDASNDYEGLRSRHVDPVKIQHAHCEVNEDNTTCTGAHRSPHQLVWFSQNLLTILARHKRNIAQTAARAFFEQVSSLGHNSITEMLGACLLLHHRAGGRQIHF